MHDAGTDQTAITLAKQSLSITFASLPQDVVERAKWLFLDHLGCMIAGAETWQSHMLSDYVVRTDAQGGATVFGQAIKVTAAGAAHANGHSASIYSLDDSLIRFGHPGCSIIPAALAEAEVSGVKGDAFLAAVVAGYEVSLRIGKSLVGTPERELIVKGNATWQVFGSVAAVSNMRQTPLVQTADAFGIAAMHAPVPFIRKFHSKPMNWLKNNYGWACRAGVVACDLAGAGFNGNRGIFDGEEGFWVMAGSDRSAPEWFTKDFGTLYLTRDVGFKPYGVCRWIHTSVDAVRDVIADHGITADTVKALKIETVGEFVRDFTGPWPKGTLEAVFHIPYGVALEFFDRSSARGLHEADLTNPELEAFAQKISVTQLPGADEKFYGQGLLPVRVTALMDDGRELVAEAEVPRGDPRGPVYGFADVSEKFLGLTENVLGRETAQAVVDMVSRLENHAIPDVMALVNGARAK